MRYMIGYLVRGEAAEYYKLTCADLAARFGVEDVSVIVPPHITLKSPFERPDVEMVDDVLSLVAEAPAIPISLNGWGHFGNRTIFLDVPKPPAELKTYMKNALTKLRAIGIQLSPQEADPHIHISFARFLKPRQYDDVWKHLSASPTPSFDITFDNLTIFVKENRDDKTWKVLKTFPLTGKRG